MIPSDFMILLMLGFGAANLAYGLIWEPNPYFRAGHLALAATSALLLFSVPA